MPSNSCSLVRLSSRQLNRRILLLLQFEFLALRGHMFTVRIVGGHIIRATYQATCPFECFDARAYSLYRDAFWVAYFILTSRVVHLSCFLCVSSLLPVILSLPLFFSIVSDSFFPGQSFFLSYHLCCSVAFGFPICVAMFWVALPQGIVFVVFDS